MDQQKVKGKSSQHSLLFVVFTSDNPRASFPTHKQTYTNKQISKYKQTNKNLIVGAEPNNNKQRVGAAPKLNQHYQRC